MKFVLRQEGKDCEETQARMAIKPGMKLYGYCGGRFGRDSYGEKTVLEVHENHLVVKEDGFVFTSYGISDWVGLIEDSNRALKEQEQYEAENED